MLQCGMAKDVRSPALVVLSAPPRVATMRPRAWLVRLGPPAMGLVVTGLLATLLWRDTVELRKIASDPARATARITSLRTKTRGIHTSGSRKVRMGYEYDAGGVTYKGSIVVTEAAVERARAGQERIVTYLRSDPSVHRAFAVDETTAMDGPTIVLFMLLTLVVVGIVTLLTERDARRRLHLARHGWATTGTILDEHARRGTVEYAFDLSAEHEGVCTHVLAGGAETELLVPGRKVTVLFDPERSEHRLWIELARNVRFHDVEEPA